MRFSFLNLGVRLTTHTSFFSFSLSLQCHWGASALMCSFTITTTDVPYDDQQAIELGIQMDNIPATADFVVHVGDIRSARDGDRCRVQQYQQVSNLLQQSAVPVFIVPGDNEWNDCPNIAQGKRSVFAFQK
jgi:hypothetical protein